MSLITILEGNRISENRKNWYLFLSLEKFLVEKYFSWLNLTIDIENQRLFGKGNLNGYKIELYYSPFFEGRYDRIYIRNKNINYNDKIHLYGDKSLCLYHPIVDKPLLKSIPLFQMIPWISEWIICYEQYKKYNVWLCKEIKHQVLK